MKGPVLAAVSGPRDAHLVTHLLDLDIANHALRKLALRAAHRDAVGLD